jgi:FkbH-like protein
MNDLLKQLLELQPQNEDYTELLKWSRRIDKQSLILEDAPILKVAVCGSRNTQFFSKILHVFLMNQGFQVSLYESEYDSMRFEILNPESGLYRFQPEILILLPSFSDIIHFPALLDSPKQVDEVVEESAAYYKSLWDTVLSHHSCVILQANFVLPIENALDQLEINVPYSKTVFLTKLNLALMDKPKQIHLIDENGLSNEIGKTRWFDPANTFLNKAPYAYEYLPKTVWIYVRKIMALRGSYHKVLVLDLDNTLWGGVIGDDGVEGIQLDPNNALGEAYLSFQSFVLSLKEKGVILAVCSKNEESNAKLGFTHPNMRLKTTDIACFIANWKDKASNLKTIAESLNVKTDALVFFDDNPAERLIVKQFCPEVEVIEVPEDPSYYSRALYDAHAFDWPQITKEDLLRIKAVEGDLARESLKTQFVDYEAYLRSLEMSAFAGKINTAQIERFVQLTNKSNQFNLRTQRLSEADVIELMKHDDVACISVDLSDRFSPYGIIACAILKKRGSTASIENWVMSCRVLNRGVENLTLNLLIQQAKDWACDRLVGEYIPSLKNEMVSQHYLKMGFHLIKENTYELDLNQSLNLESTITLKENL